MFGDSAARSKPVVQFGLGAVVAIAASAGLVGERLTRSAPPMVLLANAVATLAALLAIAVMMRRPKGERYALTTIAPQVAGALVAIAAVHLVLRYEVTSPWLSERPAQWVNDGVAVFGLLAIVWACAHQLDARLLVAVLACVTLYRATSPLWHLDRAPGGSAISIQQLVVAQLVAAALALGVFRMFVVAGSQDP
jgi:hypothetical protein